MTKQDIHSYVLFLVIAFIATTKINIIKKSKILVLGQMKQMFTGRLNVCRYCCQWRLNLFTQFAEFAYLD